MLSKSSEADTIPLPDFWGGYIIVPESVEFWQGRPSRLHDRILYTNKSNKWKKERLAP
jgi:pyridoxamine 5'-phosphate oxidase